MANKCRKFVYTIANVNWVLGSNKLAGIWWQEELMLPRTVHLPLILYTTYYTYYNHVQTIYDSDYRCSFPMKMDVVYKLCINRGPYESKLQLVMIEYFENSWRFNRINDETKRAWNCVDSLFDEVKISSAWFNKPTRLIVHEKISCFFVTL